MAEQNPLKLIEARSLPVTFRGYERKATDDLFEELKKVLTTLVAERDSAQRRAEELESRFAALEQRESEITDALVVAARVQAESERESKQQADERIQAAEAEANRILERARARARSFEEDARSAEQLAARAREQ